MTPLPQTPPLPPRASRRRLFRRARVWTPYRADATALLVDGGRVAWIGDEGGVAGLLAMGSLRGVGVEDCGGALITPSFVDAHVHLFATGISAPGGPGVAGLADVRDTAALLSAVRASAAGLPAGRPVVGFGWDDDHWQGRGLPDVTELRAAAGGREVFLGRVDMHSALLAVDGETEARQPWERDAVGGRAFARLTEDPGLRQEAIRAALGQAAAAGIGCVHEMAAPHLNPPADLDLLTALDADPAFGRIFRWWGERADRGGVARAQAAGAIGCGGDLCVDGSLGSRTAALLEPYADDPTTSGVQQLRAEEVARHVRLCVEARIGTGFHAIGDAAVTAVADGLQAAAATFGGRLPVPVRIEHAELIPSRLLPVLAHLGVQAGVQPGFQTRWGGSGGLYEQRLGVDRAAGMNRLADLAAAGIPLAFGSDAPVLPLSGWGMVRDAVCLPDPGQRLTTRAAFDAATRGGWRAAGAPVRGVLTVGAVADIAVWEGTGGAAPRSLPQLPELGPDSPLPTCRLLLVGGEVVHAAPTTSS